MAVSDGAVTWTNGPLAGARVAAASPLTQHVARAYFIRLPLSRDASPLIHHADLPSAAVQEGGGTVLLVRSRHRYPMMNALLARDIAESVVATGFYGPPAADLHDALAMKMAGAAYLCAVQVTDPRRAARLSPLLHAAAKGAAGESRHILATLLTPAVSDAPPISHVAAELLASTDLLPSRWQTRMEMLAHKLPPFLDEDGADSAADIASMYALSGLQPEAVPLQRHVVRGLVEKAIELAVYWTGR